MKRYFKKHFPERRILASKGGYFQFDTAGVPPNAIGLLALDPDDPNDVPKIADLEMLDKANHRGSVTEITEPEYEELKKKFSASPLVSAILRATNNPLNGKLRISPSPTSQRKIGRAEAAAPAVPVAPEPALAPPAPLPIRKPRLARPRALQQAAELTSA